MPGRPAARTASLTTSWVSTRCGEQVTYATTPPGRTACSAETSSSRWSALSAARSAGVRRHRASGRRRSAPRPVQGASTSTRSYAPGSSVPDRPPVARPHVLDRVRGHRPQRLLDEPRAVRLHLVGDDPRTALPRDGREQRGLAAGTGAQVEPALVGTVERAPASGRA